MIAVVLAAGDGTRMGRQSPVCKVLLQAGGKSLLAHALDNLLPCAPSRIVLVVGRFGEAIRAQFGSQYGGIPLEYVCQPNPMGLMHAVLCAAGQMRGNALLLALGDELFFDADPAAFLARFHGSGYRFACGVVRETDPERICANYSVLTDDDDRLLSCEEKPAAAVNDLKGTGFCVFDASCVQSLLDAYARSGEWPQELCDWMNALIAEGKTGGAFPVAAEEINVNTPAELERARARMKGGSL